MDVFKGATEREVTQRLQAQHDKRWPIVEAIIKECSSPSPTRLSLFALNGSAGMLCGYADLHAPGWSTVHVMLPRAAAVLPYDTIVSTAVMLEALRARWPEVKWSEVLL